LSRAKGEIATDNVVICCGVWSTRSPRWPGHGWRWTRMVHQMISVGPDRPVRRHDREISYPIVRDVDEGMYERQHGVTWRSAPTCTGDHRAAGDDPSNEEAVLSPTELPFTATLRPAARRHLS